MKKKVAIICILVVLIVTGVGVILNKNISYNAFINKHFSQEFLVKSSRVQKEIRTEILENVFDIVNLEKQDVKNIQISDETEEQLLKKVWELEVYIEKVKIDDLSKADQERFLEFKKNSIENLKELYRLIDEYNEKTIQNKNITSNYYFELQRKLTSPIESINGYIILNELKK